MPTTENTERTEKDALTGAVIGCAIDVHKGLGVGLLESAYEAALAYELGSKGIHFERQKPLHIQYKGVQIDCAYRLDFLIEDSLILEIKSVAKHESIFEAQLLTYMKLANIQKGLLINFNARWLKDGIKRMVL
ncbi:MAG: GxxExxY protein [Mariprofundaceae bacterium]|nr:GxxExxY protein [Mariprofundaceae bacterium]